MATGIALAIVLPTTDNGVTIAFRIPSGAMEPTIRAGETVQVAVKKGYVPQVGDIVVFHPPAGADSAGAGVCGNPNEGAGHAEACGVPTQQESSQTFIKRVVAGPGDTVTIVDGHVVRNGVTENEPYASPCGAEPFCTFRTPIRVPAGDYFLLGDNRGGSDDSRFWGPVPRQWIVGKVTH